MTNLIDAVIVDTSAFYKEQCDFLGIFNSIIPSFFELTIKNKITLLSHPILNEEIIKHISETCIAERLENFKKSVIRYRNILPIININSEDIIKKIDDYDYINNSIEKYTRYYKNAYQLKYPDSSEVFKKYFSSEPPFSQRGDKKNEFPDAFILCSLMEFIKKEKKHVLVISNDDDWGKTLDSLNDITLVHTLGEGMRILQNCDDLEIIISTIKSDIEKEIIGLLEEELFEITSFETIDDPEIKSIKIGYIDDTFIPLRIEENRMLLRTGVEIFVSGSAEHFNEEESFWDYEEEEYIYKAFDAVEFEDATAEFNCEIEIIIDSNEESIFAVLESLKLDVPFSIDLELNMDKTIFIPLAIESE